MGQGGDKETEDKMFFVRFAHNGDLQKIWIDKQARMIKSENFGGPFDGHVGWYGWYFFEDLINTGKLIIEGTSVGEEREIDALTRTGFISGTGR